MVTVDEAGGVQVLWAGPSSNSLFQLMYSLKAMG